MKHQIAVLHKFSYFPFNQVSISTEINIIFVSVISKNTYLNK